MATLDQLQLQLSELRTEFNRQIRPQIVALVEEANAGATRDQIYNQYQSLYAAVISTGQQLNRIKSEADAIRSEFGVPAFIATVDDVLSRIPAQQTDLDTALSTATRNTNTNVSTSKAASGGLGATPQTTRATSASDPANSDTAAGGPSVSNGTVVNPLGGDGTTVRAIPGTPAGVAAGTSGPIASPMNAATTAGSQQPFLSREDAGPPLTQNTRAQLTAALSGGPLPNLLDAYASYTYNLSLYLCTTSDYNRFATSTKIPTIALPGDQLIARSGGAPIGANQRSEFFSDVDMVIDNLKIENVIGFSETGSPSASGKLSFTITEPAGATFLYRLQSAVAALHNKDPQSSQLAAFGSTNFAMIIRFYGYDKNGNPIASQITSGVNALDAAGSSDSAQVSKIFFFLLTDVKTRIGTRIVEYHISGTFSPTQVGKGAILGVIPARFELTGTNLNDIFNGIPGSENDTLGGPVDERSEATEAADDAAIAAATGVTPKASAQPSQNIPTRGLAQALNEEFKKLSRPNKQGTKSIDIPDEYEIIFASEALKNAKIVIEGVDNNLKQTAGVKPTDTKALNTRGNTSIAKNSKILNALPGTPIIQWLDMQIRNSDYIKKQASVILDEDTDPDMPNTASGEKTNQPKSPVKWYKITPFIQQKDFDYARNSYAYKITYVISDYYVVDAKSPYFKRAPWPGPDKLYLYTFTGQNTSIISYEQDFNTLYRQTFQVNAPLDSNAQARQAGIVGPSYAFRVVAETGKQGSLGDSTDLSARAAAGLYSQTDQASVKIKIVGDPDYLLQDWYNINQALVTSRGAGRSTSSTGETTFNSNGSELYIQITFLTGDDWNLYTGIVNVEPKAGYVRRSSVAYRVNKVLSTFHNGRFEQEIHGTILSGVDPERALVKGDYVAGASVGATPAVNTDTTDTNSTSARQETTDAASQATGAFDTDGSNDLRTQEGGFSSVPQSDTSALPAPPPPISSPLAGRLQELGVQRDQFRRGLLPNQAQTGNDDAPPDPPYG